MKERRRAIDGKLIEKSKSNPGYYKYQFTIKELNGDTNVIPSYGVDMTDALQRILKNEKKEKFKECNVSSMNKLITEATSIPKNRRKSLHIKSFPNEQSAQNHLYSIMEKNKNVKSYLGQGYYNSILPFPIKRYILENPKWYTAYTPYQAEIS